MKLNPPASSSDLEVARGVARRLHHKARGTEPGPDPAPTAPPPRPDPRPLAARSTKKREPERAPRPPEPVESESMSEQEFTDPNLELDDPASEPDPPELDAPELEPEIPEMATSELEPEPSDIEPPELEPEPPELQAPDLEPEAPPLEAPELPDLQDLEASVEPESPPPPPEPLFEPNLPQLDDEPPFPAGEPAVAAQGSDTGEFQPGTPGEPGLEESMLEQLPPGGYVLATPGESSSADEPSFEEASDEEDALADLAAPPSASELDDLEPPEASVSPEDLLSDAPSAPDAPPAADWSEAALEAEMVGGDEEPQPEPEPPAAPPSPWDEVADSCLALAPANGAMLVDPAGQVLTARGDWPEPGPEAIAGRLVSMMEKKLRDAPTRSVSAPLAGQHLTAWRVPGAEGYLTVVFMADAPLKADIRPAIDTVVQAAGG